MYLSPFISKLKIKNMTFVHLPWVLFLFISSSVLAANNKSWFVSLDAGGFYDSNITNASRNRDTVEDEGVYANLNLDFDYDLSYLSLMTARVIVSTEQYDTVENFSSSSFGGELSYSWQNQLGFLAPFYKVSIGVLKKDADFDEQDGNEAYFQVIANRRVLDSLTARLGYQYQLTNAEQDIYDINEHKLFLNADYFISDHLSSYMTLSYKVGDIISSAQGSFCNGLPAEDIYPLIKSSEIIRANQALNSHFCGDWFSYKLDADTTSLTFGFNYQFNLGVSLDISALVANSEVNRDINYQRELYRAGILVSF